MQMSGVLYDIIIPDYVKGIPEQYPLSEDVHKRD